MVSGTGPRNQVEGPGTGEGTRVWGAEQPVWGTLYTLGSCSDPAPGTGPASALCQNVCPPDSQGVGLSTVRVQQAIVLNDAAEMCPRRGKVPVVIAEQRCAGPQPSSGKAASLPGPRALPLPTGNLIVPTQKGVERVAQAGMGKALEEQSTGVMGGTVSPGPC